MTMQRLCHARIPRTSSFILRIAWLGALTCLSFAGPARSDPAPHDYPTQARVEYVYECVAKNGGKQATLYQCSCAIDRIAAALSYDDYVEAATIVKYATLPGEGGGIFRDPEEGKKRAKQYRELEQQAWKACGLVQ